MIRLPKPEHRVPLACLCAYVLGIIVSGINPASRSTWFFENLCGAIIIALAVWYYRTFRFSNRAYVQGLVFLLMHAVATWYTYPLVPMGDWMKQLFHLPRNDYDRVIHFLFGALIFEPIRELAFRREPRKHLATELFLTAGILMWFASGYEILEWWAAVTVHKSTSDQIMGMQGDIWDTQADLFVAIVGSTLAAVFDAVLSFIRKRAGAHRPAPARPIARSEAHADSATR